MLFGRKRLIAALAMLLWFAAVGRGVHALLLYAYTPALTEPAAPTWPASLPSSAPRGLPLLVMFLHPHCACSRASIAELAVLMASAQTRLEARVYVVNVPGVAEDWVDTDLVRSAARIPGVTVSVDVDGRIARQLGASVSGETLMFSTSGLRVFRGGLTVARGHEGANPGRYAVLDLLDDIDSRRPETPVFGCYLRESDARP